MHRYLFDPSSIYFKIGDEKDKEMLMSFAEKFEFRNGLWVLLERLRRRDIEMQHKYEWNHIVPVTHDNMTTTSLLSMYASYFLGHPEEKIIRIGETGLFHDAGKIESLENVLYKRDKLTPEEKTWMRLHSSDGVRILQKYGITDEDILKGVLEHHIWIEFDKNMEKVVNSYPQKSNPNQPGEFARIVAACDAATSMLYKRDYMRYSHYVRMGLDKQTIFDFAQQELVRESSRSDKNPHGVHFDPKVVEMLLPIIERMK